MTSNKHLAVLATMGIVGAALTGCGSDDSPRRVAADSSSQVQLQPNSPGGTVNVSGFPLDRSLLGLVGSALTLDTIAVIDNVDLDDPQYVSDVGPDATGSSEAYIVTPGDATVALRLKGAKAVGDPIRFILGGGTIDDTTFVTEKEVAAQPEDIADYSQLLVAGKMIQVDGEPDPVLDPYFVYGIDASGLATSLMESAGAADDVITFLLDDLISALTQQQARGGSEGSTQEGTGESLEESSLESQEEAE